jgi:putative Mn2+ efflux pump MntP
VPQTSTETYRSRDAASFMVMGGFFAVLAVLVLAGTFWADDFSFPVVLNVIAGVLLLLIGLSLVALSRRGSKRNFAEPPPDSSQGGTA